MWKPTITLILTLLLQGVAAVPGPKVRDESNGVKYEGLERNGIELFLNIRYGQDTGGPNRFKPPKPYVPAAGSTINAQSYGPACPQVIGPILPPFILGNITEISENCLNLVVARPKGTSASDRFPVFVWIHGGGFWSGSNDEPTTRPDGLVRESVKSGLPIIHVAMNYRLGVFGFAQSDALKSEGSLNAGLRDQRLALEWVRNNIKKFGGDPQRVTVAGHSSGGLGVGLQLTAYGASRPVPFQQAICQSQAVGPGITGNFTIKAMREAIDLVRCKGIDIHSREMVNCLRTLDKETLLNATIATYSTDGAHNLGDVWLPAVDGDFLPSAPTELIKQGRFAKVPTMIGWTEEDLFPFTDFTITTADDTRNFISSYVPDVTAANINTLLSLYPVSDFAGEQSPQLGPEFFRSSRIIRDILMLCQPLWYGQQIAKAGSNVFLYDWNQTILDPLIETVFGVTGVNPIHSAEWPYVFNNISAYDIPGFPIQPKPKDYELAQRASKAWSIFTNTGRPGNRRYGGFSEFGPAFPKGGDTYIYVVGGPDEGFWTIDGRNSTDSLKAQKLRQRCGFINSPEMIRQLRH